MAETIIEIDAKEPLWDLHEDAAVNALLDGPERLALEAVAAKNDGGPTAMLTLGYAVGAELEAIYGGMILDALVVVAVDTESGNLFANDLADPHGVPLTDVLDEPPPQPAADTGSEPVSGGRIGVDLARALSLPAKGGRYAVFVWLDRLVSNTVIVRIETAPPHEGQEATPLNERPSPLIPSDDAPPEGAPSALVQGAVGPAVTGRLSRDGPGALLVLDGAARQVFGVVVSSREQASIAVDLSGFLKERTQSQHPSWTIVFDGQAAQQPLPIPPAIR